MVAFSRLSKTAKAAEMSIDGALWRLDLDDDPRERFEDEEEDLLLLEDFFSEREEDSEEVVMTSLWAFGLSETNSCQSKGRGERH